MSKIPFITSITTLLLLSACGNQQAIQAPILNSVPQKVNTLSDAGLVAVNKSIGKLFFQKLDTNKDGNISLDEYKRMKIDEIEVRFKKVDKNKDGMISNDEMLMNRKNFLPGIYNKESLRYFGKSAFDTLNTDKNSILSVEEFIKMGVGKPVTMPGETPKPVVIPPQTIQLYTTIFHSLDLNRDENLNLGEFEDFIFAQMKANAEIYNPLDEKPVANPNPAPVQNPVVNPAEPVSQ